MTVNEAQMWQESFKKTYNGFPPEVTEACNMAVAALEKQIPMKPQIHYGTYAHLTTGKDRVMSFHCPKCGRFIIGLYEGDKERSGGIHPDLNGCSACLWAIDFSEWKIKRTKANEEIKFDD